MAFTCLVAAVQTVGTQSITITDVATGIELSQSNLQRAIELEERRPVTVARLVCQNLELDALLGSPATQRSCRRTQLLPLISIGLL
jgi:hypothetical protein